MDSIGEPQKRTRVFNNSSNKSSFRKPHSTEEVFTPVGHKEGHMSSHFKGIPGRTRGIQDAMKRPRFLFGIPVRLDSPHTSSVTKHQVFLHWPNGLNLHNQFFILKKVVVRSVLMAAVIFLFPRRGPKPQEVLFISICPTTISQEALFYGPLFYMCAAIPRGEIISLIPKQYIYILRNCTNMYKQIVF